MNLPYILIFLNGLDNITTYLMLNWNKAQEINPFQKYFIDFTGLELSQTIDFVAFGLVIILASHFLHKHSKISYYVLNLLLLVGFVFTVLNNLFLLSLTF